MLLFSGKVIALELRKEKKKPAFGSLGNVGLLAHLLTLWVKWCEFLCL